MTDAPRIDLPRIGWFTTRLVKGGPPIAARIHRPCHCTINGGDTNAEHPWRPTCDRYPPLAAEQNGKPINPFALWPRVIGSEITEAEYRYLTDNAEWCRVHAPEEPSARPGERIDLRQQPPIW